MINQSRPYSSFSVDDIQKAKNFYGELLGLDVREDEIPDCGTMLTLNLNGGGHVLIYPKEDHVPGSFTILNFPVKNIKDEVGQLKKRGIEFIHYEETDDHGISHNEGPLIAWFKDPAGNFLAVIEDEFAYDQKDYSQTLSENFLEAP